MKEIWLHKVLFDLHQDYEVPMKFFCDNKVAINLASNLIQHDRTKHVEINSTLLKQDWTMVACVFIAFL